MVTAWTNTMMITLTSLLELFIALVRGERRSGGRGREEERQWERRRPAHRTWG